MSSNFIYFWTHCITVLVKHYRKNDLLAFLGKDWPFSIRISPVTYSQSENSKQSSTTISKFDACWIWHEGHTSFDLNNSKLCGIIFQILRPSHNISTLLEKQVNTKYIHRHWFIIIFLQNLERTLSSKVAFFISPNQEFHGKKNQPETLLVWSPASKLWGKILENIKVR